MKKANKQIQVTFQSHADAEALALAKLGISNKVIKRDTKLTDCQITYRLSKAKMIEGNEHGYRVAWRNGESELFRKIREDMLAILRQEIQRTLPQQIIHPPAEVKEGQ